MSHRRRFLQTLGGGAACAWAARELRAADRQVEVLVYGATPAGIAAALAAARDGERVALVEPTAHLGGLVTSGLSHTDFRTFEGLTGAFLEFSRNVQAHYVREFGKDSEQAKGCFQGTQAEPKVNLAVFRRMLGEAPGITVLLEHELAGVRMAGKRVAAAEFRARGGATMIEAAQFIDASYEGDLMAAAGVPFRVGREGRAEFGESLAPEHADGELQGYNFRFIATQEPSNRVMPVQPPGYRREEFVGILPMLADGRIKTVFAYQHAPFKDHIPRLPNGKVDINDVSHSPVRLSLPGENLGWPEGGAAERRRIFAAHLRWNVGLLWFLQNDEAVPAQFRDEAREWGWCRDEFVETAHLPPQLYVREARRMTGLRIFSERDTGHAPGDARSVFQPESVAMGDYGCNCHGTAREGGRFVGRHTGEFYKGGPPYQIPYGTLAPREVENLLVPGAASASHVGFCALRLEPIWMSLGQAAGHAATQARRRKAPVQRVDAARLRVRLHEVGAATMYVSDIPPGHASFAAVQWWGAAGGLHGLAPMPEKPGQRGKQIIGQYYEAFPGHAAELDRALEPALRGRWREIARELGFPAAALPDEGESRTRGEWVLSLWRRRVTLKLA